MKNRRFIIRLIGVLANGILLLKMTYQFKDSTFIADLFVFGILAIIGLIFLIWSLFADIKNFRNHKRISFLIPVGLGIVFTAVIWIGNWQINANFDKLTLLRIYHDGDFNGTGIDFKTDGTYIFNNSAIGLSDFIYGFYKINTNHIMLDKHELDNVIKTNLLVIRPKTIEYSDRTETEKYVFQVDKNGNIMSKETEFKLVEDNRKE